MKVGDLIKRKNSVRHNQWGPGIVMSLQMGGRNPVHECATVLYPLNGGLYDIAISLIEVICESR